MVRWLALVACASAVLTACDSGGGGGGPEIAPSLAGTVQGWTSGPFRGNEPRGLAGVVVRVESTTTKDSAQATTDAQGNFIVLEPPTGMVRVHLDSTGVASGTFPDFELELVVGEGAANLAQPILLPNLDFGVTGTIDVDENGVTTGDATVGDPLVDGLSLDIPDGTTILVGGEPPEGPVDLNITFVSPLDAPVRLGEDAAPVAFVTIQPAEASFTPPLGITLPSPGDLAHWAELDLWSLDHDTGAWVNRSIETGSHPLVVDIGGSPFLVATEVIASGGWHAVAMPLDQACATTIEGRVVALGPPVPFGIGEMTPMPDALVSLSTGQFARTDAAGRFRIRSVPAYDTRMIDSCVPYGIELRALATVAFGAGQATVGIGPQFIVPGGTTRLPDVWIRSGDTGSLVGSVTDEGEPVEGEVSLVGTSTATFYADERGSFFATNLLPGPYTATFPFEHGDASVSFEIEPNETRFVRLTATPVSSTALDVLVLDVAGGNDAPVPDACVTLQGAGGVPQFAISGDDGVASFPGAPAGPYTITAQTEIGSPWHTSRRAATLVGVTPGTSPRTIVVPLLGLAGAGDSGHSFDATLEGAVLNAPPGSPLEYQVVSSFGFVHSGIVTTGTFSIDVDSDGPMQAVVFARDPSTGQYSSAVFATDLTVASGETLQLDFDFQDACAFDRTVSLAYTNEQTHTEAFAVLTLDRFRVGFYADGDLPSSVSWPDLSASKLAPFDLSFEVITSRLDPLFQQSSCAVALGHSTPSALTMRFVGTPTILSPAHQAEFDGYGPGSTVRFRLGTGNGSTAGYNSVLFLHSALSGDLSTFWQVLVSPNVTSLTLPPVFASKPMFGPGTVDVRVAAERFDFPGFAFASFFDEDLPGNLAAVRAGTQSDSFTSHSFTIAEAPELEAR